MTPDLKQAVEHIARQDSGIHEGYVQNTYNRKHIQTLITHATRPQGWRPIAEAPKDGSYFIAYKDTWSFKRILYWNEHKNKFYCAAGGSPLKPSHFMPTPQSPERE